MKLYLFKQQVDNSGTAVFKNIQIYFLKFTTVKLVYLSYACLQIRDMPLGSLQQCQIKSGYGKIPKFHHTASYRCNLYQNQSHISKGYGFYIKGLILGRNNWPFRGIMLQMQKYQLVMFRERKQVNDSKSCQKLNTLLFQDQSHHFQPLRQSLKSFLQAFMSHQEIH